MICCCAASQLTEGIILWIITSVVIINLWLFAKAIFSVLKEDHKGMKSDPISNIVYIILCIPVCPNLSLVLYFFCASSYFLNFNSWIHSKTQIYILIILFTFSSHFVLFSDLLIIIYTYIQYIFIGNCG